MKTAVKVSNKRNSIRNNVFQIRLGCHAEKINLKDPTFLKILEQEYAAKYLESMGVETSAKNIAKILKERPLQSCEIVESRLGGGLNTDTITIITRKEAKNEQTNKNQHVSQEMLKILDLKKMSLRRDKTRQGQQQYKGLKIDKKEQLEHGSDGLNMLSFDLENMKNKYIFPFNQNFTRKNNCRLRDQKNLSGSSKSEKLIFQAPIFRFPFTQIKLTLSTLKQLQVPITAKLSDILTFLELFTEQFPISIFPIDDKQEPTKQKRATHQIHICFTNKSVDKMFEILRGEQNAKLIGVFLHLGYWSVFGAVNPVEIETATKKKMYLMIKETIEYFELKIAHRKTWIDLMQPMVLLTLKMAIEYFFSLQYVKIFSSQQSLKIKANEIALDKLLLLVDRVLDQANINGRFIFLESDIDASKGKFTHDNKLIRKRIFGTSPALRMILPKPQNGKARSIMAKNMQIDQKQGMFNEGPSLSTEKAPLAVEHEDHECQQKMLNLALLKIRNRVEQFSGFNSLNPIIKLQDKQ